MRVLVIGDVVADGACMWVDSVPAANAGRAGAAEAIVAAHQHGIVGTVVVRRGGKGWGVLATTKRAVGGGGVA